MTVPRQNLGGKNNPWVAGDSRVISTQLLDANNAEILLSSLTITAAVYAISDQETDVVLVTRTLASGVNINTSANRIEVSLRPQDTAALSGTYKHELELTLADGTVTTVFVGTAQLEKDHA